MFRHNKEDDFNAIYYSTYIMVLDFVSFNCRNISDVEDIVQEVFFELYKMMLKDPPQEIKNHRALLLEIARKRLAKYYGLKNVRERNEVLLEDSFLLESLSSTDDSEENAIKRLLLKDLWQYLAKEGDDVYTIFKLRYVHNLSIEQISDMTGIGFNIVKTRLYTELEKIRRKYEKEGMAEI